MDGNLQQKIIAFIPMFIILVLAVSLHEFAHCWTADRLGDDTPRRAGRVTLNPLKHLDPLGTLMMVISAFSGYGFGWGKPSPFNPLNFRHPQRDRMLTAIAGPICNLLQMVAWASIALLCIELSSFMNRFVLTLLFSLCKMGVILNACLAMFNLLPVNPLDGHHILSYLAPESWRPIIDNPKWAFVFMAIVLIPQLRDPIFKTILDPAIDAVVSGAWHLVGLGGLLK